jgi:hypothetical protein
MVELLTKLVPFTVSVNAAPPAIAEDGLKLDIDGTGLFTENVWAPEVPPPGDGLTTVTLVVPATAMSAAMIAAVTCVLLTNVLVRLEPFHCTVDVLTKLVPLTVSVNAAPPAVAEAGLRLVIVGAGLLIENSRGGDPLPSGFETVTCAVPAVAMSDAGIVASNCVLLTNVVLRALPFHLTVEPDTKFDPLTVRLKAAPPAVALDGLSDVSEIAVQVEVLSRIDTLLEL